MFPIKTFVFYLKICYFCYLNWLNGNQLENHGRIWNSGYWFLNNGLILPLIRYWYRSTVLTSRRFLILDFQKNKNLVWNIWGLGVLYD
jgi:hypothetical protein